MSHSAQIKFVFDYRSQVFFVIKNFVAHRTEIMFIVALTGGIATGKTSVTKVFKEHGIPVVDADQIAREGR